MGLDNLEELIEGASGKNDKKENSDTKTEEKVVDEVVDDDTFEEELESFDTEEDELDKAKNVPVEKLKETPVEEKEDNKDKPEKKTVADLLDIDKDKPKTKKREVKIIKHEKKKESPTFLDRNDENKPVLLSGDGFISPACTIDEAIATFELFEDAKKRILRDTDIIWIGPNGHPVKKDQGGSPHIRRPGWCRLARFFRVSWKIISNEGSPMLSTDKDGNSKGYIYRAIVHVTHPNGASVTQSGFATSLDPFFTKGGRKDADEEDIAMKAETVSINRAISNILGSGEVSAEEISNE